MYHNFSQVYQGLSKNLFAAFEYKIPQFLFVWLWLGFVLWGPLAVLVLAVAGLQFSSYSLILAMVAVTVALFQWGITHWRFAFPPYLTLLYPITILLSVIIAFNSMVLTLTNRATWKDRALVRASLR
jgi:chlorobactene glucosyltransferase